FRVCSSDLKLFLLLRLNSIYEGDAAVTITPDATMEHILPQRPAATGRWAQDFDGEADAAVLKHMLGNLTLLTEPEQNRAGNREFEAKRSVYGSSAFTLSRQLAGWESWTADAIRARTVQLADDLLGALGAE
ncbi:MAG: HNH endonuclease family protein, partial [Hyphomicrobiaceae bacterium]